MPRNHPHTWASSNSGYVCIECGAGMDDRSLYADHPHFYGAGTYGSGTYANAYVTNTLAHEDDPVGEVDKLYHRQGGLGVVLTS